MEVNNNISIDDQDIRQDGNLKPSETSDFETAYKEKMSYINDLKGKIDKAEDLRSLLVELKKAQKEAEDLIEEEAKTAQDKAKQEKREKQDDDFSRFASKPTLFMLFLAFKKGYENKMEELKAGEEAAKSVHLKAEDARDALQNAKRPELKENECIVFISTDADKRDVKTLRTDEEVNSFLHGDELKSWMDRAEKEKDLPENEKTISFALIDCSDAKALDKMIREKYGDIQSLGQKSLGDLQHDLLNDKNSIRFNFGNPLLFERDFSETMTIGGKELFSEKEVLEKLAHYGYDKDNIPADDMKKLKEGEKTNLLKISIKTDETEVTTLDARFRLVRTPDGNTKLMLHPVRKELDLNITQFKGYTLTEQDKQNLRTVGTCGKTVNLTTAGGKQVPCIIGADKLTNELVALNPARLKIPAVVAGAKLNDKEKETLKQGKPVKRDDLIDKQGVKYSGWILLNPAQKSLDITTKQPPLQIAQDFTPQVKANNDGARTEELKTDKSTTMDRRQTKNNDPVEPKKDKKKGMKI